MSGRRDAGPDDGVRWAARPRLALAVRTAIVMGPVVASIASGLLVARLLGDAPLWQFVPVVGSVCISTSLVVERVARRFLPLRRCCG